MSNETANENLANSNMKEDGCEHGDLIGLVNAEITWCERNYLKSQDWTSDYKNGFLQGLRQARDLLFKAQASDVSEPDGRVSGVYWVGRTIMENYTKLAGGNNESAMSDLRDEDEAVRNLVDVVGNSSLKRVKHCSECVVTDPDLEDMYTDGCDCDCHHQPG